jgi:hypothetical protein
MIDKIRFDEVKFSSQFQAITNQNLAEIIKRFGESVIQLSNEQGDHEESHDFKFRSMLDLKISARVAAFKNHQYFNQQIRSRSKLGGKTEIDKIAAGHGDIYITGWKNESGDDFCQWLMIDLRKIREHLFNNGRLYKNPFDKTEVKFYDLPFLRSLDAIINFNPFIQI